MSSLQRELTWGLLKKTKAEILQADEAPMYTNTSSAIGEEE
jgi:hypothetical protein